MTLLAKQLIAGLLAVSAMAASPARATVVNFDSLPGNGPMPATYGGIAWAPGWNYVSVENPAFNAHSSPTRVYSVDAETSFSFLNGDQVFEGAWFAGYYYVSFNLYYDGELVHSSPVLEMFGSGPARFLATGYAGLVDSVTVVGVAGGYAMDDLTYHAEVPEPGMPELLAAGMLAAAGLNARSRKSEPRVPRSR